MKSDRHKRYRENNRDKINELARQYRNKMKSNPEWIEKQKEFVRKSYKKHRKKRLENTKKWQKENKDKVNAISRKCRLKNPVIYIIISIKSSAKRRGIYFNLKKEDIVIPSVCPILGIPLYYGTRTNKNNSPSVDRVDNSKGYTKDNIRVISYRANNLKGDATIPELTAILKYMEAER